MRETEKRETAEDFYGGTSSTMILVIGPSGSGKSRSLKGLNPETTRVVNVKGKRLPFASGVRDYTEGKNIFTRDSASWVMRIMKDMNTKCPEVRDIVIDDGYYLMINEMFDKIDEKGYDKWNHLAKNINNVLSLGNQLRGDLKCYFMGHEEDVFDGGQLVRKQMKTCGQLLNKSVTPEGICTIVLFSRVRKGEKGKRRYYFETQSDGVTTAKSPEGMFPGVIPNDLGLVSKRIDEYFEEGVERWEDSRFRGEFEVKEV